MSIEDNPAVKDFLAFLKRELGEAQEHHLQHHSDFAAAHQRIKELEGLLGEAQNFITKISLQLPEKPDYWSSCGQCERNIEYAVDLVEDWLSRAKGESHD